jgi:hypothetical protein
LSFSREDALAHAFYIVVAVWRLLARLRG